MAAVNQLGYLGLKVNNLNAWEEFATNILGLQVSEREEECLFLRMDDHHHRITLHAGPEDDLAYTGWQVKDQAALEEVTGRLTREGISWSAASGEEARERRVEGLVKLSDPSGIATELYYGPLVQFQTPFDSPRPISGFVAGEQGLGHIVVSVNDLRESLHFYCEVLGMRISDFIRFQPLPGMTVHAAFLHCNPRHHSLAFAEGRLGEKRLHHFMLQMKSVDDVGSTYYMVQEREIPITSSLGRHTNDHMLSFYMRSPSGFEIEYGWGARTVDDATWQVQTHTAASMWGHRRAGRPQPAAV